MRSNTTPARHRYLSDVPRRSLPSAKKLEASLLRRVNVIPVTAKIPAIGKIDRKSSPDIPRPVFKKFDLVKSVCHAKTRTS
jgi:hypothetical protein